MEEQNRGRGDEDIGRGIEEKNRKKEEEEKRRRGEYKIDRKGKERSEEGRV